MALRPQLVCSTGCGLCCIVLGSPKDTFWFRLTWDLCPEKRVRVLVAMARLPQTSAEVSICPVGLHTSPAAPGEVWCVQVSGSVPPPHGWRVRPGHQAAASAPHGHTAC